MSWIRSELRRARQSAHPAIHSSAKTGVSLVELLVVIAVVGILAAILIPVVGNIQKLSATTKTVSNLRQLQMANATYAAENNAEFTPLFAGPGIFETGWKWNDAFLSFLGLEEVPSSGLPTVFHSGYYDEDANPYATIGYSAYRVSSRDHPWVSNDQPHAHRQPTLKDPSQLIAFIDANDWWVNPYEFDNWNSTEDDGPSGRSIAGPAYRNKGETAAAVTYAGNVIMVSREELDWNTDSGSVHWFYDGTN